MLCQTFARYFLEWTLKERDSALKCHKNAVFQRCVGMVLKVYRGEAPGPLSSLFYSYKKNFTINLTIYYTFLLYDTTGKIPRGVKDHDYPMANLKTHEVKLNATTQGTI